MPLAPEAVLAECQRLESVLRDVRQRALVPQPHVLTDCEHELAGIASSLEELRRSIGQGGAAQNLRGNATIRQALGRIQQMARDLGTGFLHGSNYCAGLLQIRLGTGYSEQGLPVLAPNQSRTSVEG